MWDVPDFSQRTQRRGKERRGEEPLRSAEACRRFELLSLLRCSLIVANVKVIPSPPRTPGEISKTRLPNPDSRFPKPEARFPSALSASSPRTLREIRKARLPAPHSRFPAPETRNTAPNSFTIERNAPRHPWPNGQPQRIMKQPSRSLTIQTNKGGEH